MLLASNSRFRTLYFTRTHYFPQFSSTRKTDLPSYPSRRRRHARFVLASRRLNDGSRDGSSESSWRQSWSSWKQSWANWRSPVPAEFIALGLYVVYDFGSGYYIGYYKGKTRFSSNSYAWMPWDGHDITEEDRDVASDEPDKHTNERGYAPLKRSFEIRLLAIHPGKEDSPVECSLHHQKLRGGRGYEAVSYVWGDSNNMLEIVCNEKPRSVRKNLYDALTQLRRPDKERFVWVDMLCVDQDNNAEKTQQVRIMGEIYSNARRVLIWLGNEPRTEKSLNLLVETFKNRDKMPVREDPDWDTVLHLFSNQWFRRVWCIQEVVLAKKPVVLSGNSSVEWETFVNAGRWVRNNSFLRTTSREHTKTLEHLDVLQKMRDTRKNTHWLERHSLLQLVFLTRGFEATDPRDKLFALVGLASDVMSSDWEVTPDYDLSLSEVYRRFALWHLTRNRQVEVFSLGTNRDLPSSEELETLPSWVPDLTRPDMAAPLPKLDYLSPNYIDIRYDILKEFRARAHHLKNAIKVYHADLNLPWWGLGRRSRFEPPRIAFTEGTSVIHLVGTEIGTVKTLGTTLDDTNPNISPLVSQDHTLDMARIVQTGRWLRESWRLVTADNSGNKHELPNNVFESAWRTMICDMTSDGHNVKPGVYRDVSREIYKSVCAQMMGEERKEAESVTAAKESAISDIAATGKSYDQSKSKATGMQVDDDDKAIFNEDELLVHLPIRKWYDSRRFGINESGDFAAVPKATRTGDIICIFNGGRVPYVLRPGKRGYYQLVGECYVHGMMRGEVKVKFPSAEYQRNFAIR
ncbi:heterokaryon incompatibility protein-domain-containing protein [Ilyonectria sp. MPI-CAGE-AT-0026]|nr:heterokaryon incompatibility protein-domain-containing protein [Ilyonectria sp. MPI-CAGE-AT-0026]